MILKSVTLLALCVSLGLPPQSEPASAPGALDPSFGSGGKVTTSFGFSNGDAALAVAIQPDGKILAAGHGGVSYGLLRYNPDGSLDSSFGSGGKVVTDFFGSADGANAMILQPDGKIIAAGSSFRDSTYEWEFSLARYNGDGSLDSSFGVDGRVLFDFADRFSVGRAVALLPDGKIVVAGGVFSSSSNPLERAGDFALVRFKKDGRLDKSFGEEGRVTTDFLGGDDEANAVIVQPDGKIVAIGYANRPGTNDRLFAAARYNPDGSMDRSFGSRGKVTNEFPGFGSIASAGLLQPDGKIVLAGYASVPFTIDFGLMRLNPDGSLDSTFGQAGRVSIDFFNGSDNARAVALQRNGKIVVAGVVTNGTNLDFGIARLNRDGSVDARFGDGGKASLDFFHLDDGAEAIAIQDDGKIVVAGIAQSVAPILGIGLARFVSSSPIVKSAVISGKQLIIDGTGFEDNATILVNGIQQKTANDSENPTAGLVGKKAGKKIKPGDKVRVLNSDGALSPEFIFTG
jgi:uncharacterized delta-60 repeat protein